MISIDKGVLVNMLAPDGDFWVQDVLMYPGGGPIFQLCILPKAQARKEPFPGVTSEVYKFILTDEVDHILSVVKDKERRIVTVALQNPGSTHTEGTA